LSALVWLWVQPGRVVSLVIVKVLTSWPMCCLLTWLFIGCAYRTSWLECWSP
jgi:hypothetical protein